MLIYKFDVLKELKDHGYNTTRILRENIIGQSAVQQIRNGHVVGAKGIDKLCSLLEMQPGQIIRYMDDLDYKNRYLACQLEPYEIDKEKVKEFS